MSTPITAEQIKQALMGMSDDAKSINARIMKESDPEELERLRQQLREELSEEGEGE